MPNKICSLKETLSNTCLEVMGMFGLSPIFLTETGEKTVQSDKEIIVSIKFSNGLNGKIILALNKDIAVKILSAMMCGMEINEIDAMAQSGLCEFTNMIAGSAMMKVNSKELIDLHPPEIELNENFETKTLQNESSRKLLFELDNSNFEIHYYIE